jgi:conflict system STAND superfamily ATPase
VWGLPELLGPGQDAHTLAAHLRTAVDEPGYVFTGALGRVTQEARRRGCILAFEKAQLMLVVDQLEELFTLPGISAEDRRAMIRLLAGLVRSGVVWVVATLRADFWHRAADMPDMMALAQGHGRLDIAAPSPAELADMIRKPMQAAGLFFESHPETHIGLDAVLAERAAAEPGVLPLLSFTLDELYRRDVTERHGRVLTYTTYDALGGLEGAIATQGDRILIPCNDVD